MPLLVKLDNKRLWDRPEWLPSGEVPAEALRAFSAEGNELSAWYIEPDQSNMDRILAALAANRQYIEKIDYALFEEILVGNCGIALKKTRGAVPDEYAAQVWHRDLVELSGRKLLCLAESISTSSPQRKSMPAIRQLLLDAAKSGQIKRELMQEGIATKLDWPDTRGDEIVAPS
jgi:hypothetical protein